MVKGRGAGHPSPPRSQHSHPLCTGVFNPCRRRDLRDLGDQVRVFLSSLLEHLPGRKPEIGAVVPHPSVGTRPGPRVGARTKSRGDTLAAVHPRASLVWAGWAERSVLGLRGTLGGPTLGRWG